MHWPSSKLRFIFKFSNIIAAAEITNADAIHPGYGFLSENAKFSKICEEHNIKFIGASPEMINKMGDKATAKATMIEAGVQHVPGSEGIIESFDHCKKLAKEVGYPVMLKASAGGGGKGMRAVWKADQLEDAWNSARVESKAALQMTICIWKSLLRSHVILRFKLLEIQKEKHVICLKEIVLFKDAIKN